MTSLAELPPFEDVVSKPVREAPADWDAVLTAAPVAPVHYTRSLLDYQAAYMRPYLDEVVDRSSVFFHENKPVAIFPVSVQRRTGQLELRSHEAPVRAPLIVPGLPESVEKRIEDACARFLLGAAEKLGVATFTTTQAFRGASFGTFHARLMEAGARTRLRHGLYVDLGRTPEALWSAVRRRYRSLINKGKASWKVEVLEGAHDDVFDAYRLLHLEVAGRVTRERETWDMQAAAMGTADAFLVTLRDETSRLVGGGLFYVSKAGPKSEGLYAVGVYDRKLFDKPLGHVVQWTAIEHMKSRGFAWYFIGERFYPTDEPRPSDKEVQIAHFKEGFATHVLPHVELHWGAGAETSSVSGTEDVG